MEQELKTNGVTKLAYTVYTVFKFSVITVTFDYATDRHRLLSLFTVGAT
jgi:hypothetical protein